MKARILKRTIATAALALLTVATPVMAQQSAGDSSYSSGSQTEMNEPAGADNERNWSWIGLLGLLGLFGLKKRHDVHDENYRTARA